MSFKYLYASVELVADTSISTFSSFCRLLPLSAIIVNYTLASQQVLGTVSLMLLRIDSRLLGALS